MEKIIEYTGAVDRRDLDSLESPIADSLVGQIKIKKKSFREYFSSVDEEFYELINGLLVLNPQKRLTVD